MTGVDATQLGLRVVRLALPPGLDAKTGQIILSEIDDDAFSLNHLYELASGDNTPCNDPVCRAKAEIAWPTDASACGAQQTIGIIDTAVKTDHPALRDNGIVAKRFGDHSRTASEADHGTAVAGLLVGNSESATPGLVPRANLHAADPFFITESGRNKSDTSALIESVDWLIAQGARVIGLSLSGPANPILEEASRRAREKGVLLVAAAGNGGRNAGPVFPAGYDGVLSVTAVAEGDRIYRRANQGNHVDFAAPGVRVWTLDLSGDGRHRSGTSFAVPFVVALASQAIAEGRTSADQLRRGDGLTVVDLGQPGRDPVFGWGRPLYKGNCNS